MHRIRTLLSSVLLALALGAASCGSMDTVEIPYSTLKQHIAKGDVREVRMSATEVRAVPTASARQSGAPEMWIATPVPNDAIVPLLESKNITYQGIKADESHIALILGILAGLTFVIILGMSYKRMNPVKSMTALARGRRARDKKGRPHTGFDSVAGVDEAKEELEEIVKFLRSPSKFASLGARVPKGALLVGPPGTGKTLLARAVAGEAGVPFFSASGSEFIEVFVGVGASRVRKLFEQAKAKAPAIVFIDELDAIGKSRSGSHGGGGTDEREQTLNQLLVEMDGFDSRDGIIVLGATNRPEILDTALLRPGRFDRQVLVDRPDGTGRHAILQVHARKVKLAGDVDLEYVARRTPGMVGADLENVLNEAALLAARGEKKRSRHARAARRYRSRCRRSRAEEPAHQHEGAPHRRVPRSRTRHRRRTCGERRTRAQSIDRPPRPRRAGLHAADAGRSQSASGRRADGSPCGAARRTSGRTPCVRQVLDRRGKRSRARNGTGAQDGLRVRHVVWTWAR